MGRRGKLNGRVHLAEDVSRAYALIRQAGFDWVNLDLMCGLLGETEEKWSESVRRAIALGSSDPSPHNNLGGALYSLGKLKEAVEELRKAT